VNRSDNAAYSRVQPDRTSWPLPNRESLMNESHKAPADHPAPHPNDSPASALFTFIQPVDMPHQERRVPILRVASPRPGRGNVGTLSFLHHFRCPFCFKSLVPIFKFPFSNFHFPISKFSFLISSFSSSKETPGKSCRRTLISACPACPSARIRGIPDWILGVLPDGQGRSLP
jgi:hypothetical protein